ncbi:NAD-P-binding protein [Stereum hirsutum FP-91666 SS1]|uniref:NAD-P-binding protein n=1 Tax=Stereum hirsutum (strain FP-91666) TaxID=721885 RepID=UPI000444A64D|nr:NAD-P-binding protein [Stereum hirsutum FP-91666 SS1]EIM84838.1 NAD-P-binding protein [Stereum hirsutum FP-91666 SS1]
MSWVLITSASGFTGSHVVHHLLEAGYLVRGTARSARKAEQVRDAYAGTAYRNRFQVAIVPDFATSDMTEAFRGVSAVIHVGCPLGGSPEVVLEGAVSGTKNILRHALKAGVKKIVATSSIVCMAKFEDFWKRRVIGVNDWNTQCYEDAFDPDRGLFDAYAVAKSLAEQELRRFHIKHPDVDVTTIHPPFIYGPYGHCQVTDNDSFVRLNSNGLLYALISGSPDRSLSTQSSVMPMFVHVSDLARAHVLALKTPPSKQPKRILISGGSFTWQDAIELIAKMRPQLQHRLPKYEEANAQPCASLDTSSARQILGIKRYRGWRETVLETIDSLIRMEQQLGL